MSIQEVRIATPTFEQITITPSYAGELLKRNTKNRKIRESSVIRLTEVLKNGEWRFNAQPIQIGEDGSILDGQHRLWACVRSGISINVLLVRNADISSQETMDMGVSRSTVDILTLRGFKEPTKLVSLANRVITYDKSTLGQAMVGRAVHATPGEVVAFAENFTGYDRYIRFAETVSNSARISWSIVSFAMWLTDEIDFEDSDYFWSKVKSGSGLEDGNPILALRNWSLDVTRDRSLGGGARSIETYARIFKVWNKFRAGESLNRLQWKPGGSKPEAFPEPK